VRGEKKGVHSSIQFFCCWLLFLGLRVTFGPSLSTNAWGCDTHLLVYGSNSLYLTSYSGFKRCSIINEGMRDSQPLRQSVSNWGVIIHWVGRFLLLESVDCWYKLLVWLFLGRRGFLGSKHSSICKVLNLFIVVTNPSHIFNKISVHFIVNSLQFFVFIALYFMGSALNWKST